MSFTDLLLGQHATAITALDGVCRDVAAYRTLTDDDLLEVARSGAVLQRLAGATSAIVAGEIARRSDASLGQSGLAQRTGYRTAIELVRVTTGLTGRDAAAAVRVGALTQASADPGTAPHLGADRPWLLPLGRALADGILSIAAAESVRAGLGEPGPGVSAEALARTVDQLCAEAATLDADRLFRRARQRRDEIDEAGIAEREAERRDSRSLSFTRLADGMARLSWLMDPETSAIVGDLWDRATSPRRGGPRFVDPGIPNPGDSDDRLARRITDDTRTTGQLASDVFTELLRQGSATDTTQLLGSGAPVVHLIVRQECLDTKIVVSDPSRPSAEPRSGHGHYEGQLDPVSLDTIRRALCDAELESLIVTANGQPLDVGREHRLYTRKQRRALAIRDGGCRFPGCDRPPSWTEAHHTRHWQRDHGETNLDDGILLCRHHHLLCHNNHWEIRRTGTGFVLIPPPDIDPEQSPIPMPTKSAAMRELIAETG